MRWDHIGAGIPQRGAKLVDGGDMHPGGGCGLHPLGGAGAGGGGQRDRDAGGTAGAGVPESGVQQVLRCTACARIACLCGLAIEGGRERTQRS